MRISLVKHRFEARGTAGSVRHTGTELLGWWIINELLITLDRWRAVVLLNFSPNDHNRRGIAFNCLQVTPVTIVNRSNLTVYRSPNTSLNEQCAHWTQLYDRHESFILLFWILYDSTRAGNLISDKLIHRTWSLGEGSNNMTIKWIILRTCETWGT